MSEGERNGEVVLSGGTATLEATRLEEHLRALERPPRARKPLWTWLVVLAGLALVFGLSYHGAQAYATIARINANARIETPDPVRLFQTLASTGPQIPSTVETSQRSNYTRALEQLILDGTGVAIGLAMILAGLFARINH